MWRDGLGISVYVSPQGRITQNNQDGLSREIRPRPGAKMAPHQVDALKGSATAADS